MATSITPLQLVQIASVPRLTRLRPSQFNSRATAPDGTLILYNSFSGAFSGFPIEVVPKVKTLLSRQGVSVPLEGVAKYLHERGYLVEMEVNELDRSRVRYASHQYRPDELELILLTSEECNFRCVYCYETFPRGTMEPWVRTSIIKLIESRSKRLSRLSVSYFGGEPLLGLEAIREIAPAMLRVCSENDIEFSAGMTTNGFLLTPEVFSDLVSWKISSFQITIDGPQNQHDAHRPLKGGGSTFDTVLGNVLSMRHSDKPFGVALRVNFDQSNRHAMDQLLDCLEPIKNDQRFVLRFYPVGKWGGTNDESLDTCGLSGESVRQALDISAQKRGFAPETNWNSLQPSNRGTMCYAARPNNMIIGADGKIMKCTIALDTKDYNIVGTLNKEGHAKLDLDKMAKWVKPYFEEDAVCKKCFHLPLCHGSSCPVPRIETGSRPCPPEKMAIVNTLQTLWEVRKGSGHRAPLSAQ